MQHYFSKCSAINSCTFRHEGYVMSVDVDFVWFCLLMLTLIFSILWWKKEANSWLFLADTLEETVFGDSYLFTAVDRITESLFQKSHSQSEVEFFSISAPLSCILSSDWLLLCSPMVLFVYHKLPPQYHHLAEASTPPPHRSYFCAIELLPGTGSA